MNPPIPDRRPDLDALRVFACYLLFLFHVGMAFNPAPFFHVRNDQVSGVFLILCGFISLWHMPLFFLLAGWSAAASLRKRGVAVFLRERGAKLAIPLAVGCALLAPGIKYVELRSGLDLNHRGLRVSAELQESFRAVVGVELPLAADFDESFVEFLPTFFTDLDRFSWSHLWFLAYLLSLTLVLLPVLAALVRRGPASRAPARLTVYLPLLPLFLIQLGLRERFPGPYNLYNDWASVSYYATFLLAGVLLAVDPRLEEKLRQEWRRAFGVGVAASLVLLCAVLELFQSSTVVLSAVALAGWCFLVAGLGFARERITRAGPRLGYLAESAFPIYLLHQPVIVFLAWGIVALPLSLVTKFLLLLVASVAVTLCVYHFAVRPFGPTRFLTGMKPLSRASRAPAADLVSAAAMTATSRVERRIAPLALLLLLLADSANASDPTGLWWAEQGAAQVEIVRCGDALCGRVAWLRNPLDERGCSLRDAENPDPARRRRPLVGMDILRNLRSSPANPQEWDGGEIYDPTSGRTYAAVLRLDDPDRLSVRGYLGIRLLGRTARWFRVGSEGQCREDA